ncbi:MAG: ornithine carbamoyltransferase [Candidatus Nanohaloarchaeota archaeon QJJ-5]|nr:ornithine carbamoyltransferase [Candidatus Nanohaloarchaeota archaeon QJJ-5]
MQNFIDIADIATDQFMDIIETTDDLKHNKDAYRETLEDQTLLMLFEKPSTRTRISFEAGMTELGGHGIYFYSERSQMSRGESLKDTAIVISRYCDAIMARLYSHEKMQAIADHATVPVINGLTDKLHPCQALSDFYSLQEDGFELGSDRLVYIGDGNNVAHSLMQAADTTDTPMTVCTPEEDEPADAILEASDTTELVHDPEEAVADADALYTDVWVSMGDDGADAKRDRLQPYQINMDLLAAAPDHVRVMHCLPAHRGEEITDAVMDSDASIIYEQAENRMHTQQALVLHLLDQA